VRLLRASSQSSVLNFPSPKTGRAGRVLRCLRCWTMRTVSSRNANGDKLPFPPIDASVSNALNLGRSTMQSPKLKAGVRSCFAIDPFGHWLWGLTRRSERSLRTAAVVSSGSRSWAVARLCRRQARPTTDRPLGAKGHYSGPFLTRLLGVRV
jgi:hypothetical protein